MSRVSASRGRPAESNSSAYWSCTSSSSCRPARSAAIARLSSVLPVTSNVRAYKSCASIQSAFDLLAASAFSSASSKSPERSARRASAYWPAGTFGNVSFSERMIAVAVPVYGSSPSASSTSAKPVLRSSIERMKVVNSVIARGTRFARVSKTPRYQAGRSSLGASSRQRAPAVRPCSVSSSSCAMRVARSAGPGSSDSMAAARSSRMAVSRSCRSSAMSASSRCESTSTWAWPSVDRGRRRASGQDQGGEQGAGCASFGQYNPSGPAE